ncbi:hypothetical protein AB0E10_35305 [Streptomyces sp. NPDC048045]|uniref:hypothetical protein n=1 Tax=Streptomyces sp. NPDC048045 TaxID=3154710 RepID=UPI00341E97F7
MIAGLTRVRAGEPVARQGTARRIAGISGTSLGSASSSRTPLTAEREGRRYHEDGCLVFRIVEDKITDIDECVPDIDVCAPDIDLESAFWS